MFDAPELSRDAPFQHPKLISSKSFDVYRPSKPSPILTMTRPNKDLRRDYQNKGCVVKVTRIKNRRINLANNVYFVAIEFTTLHYSPVWLDTIRMMYVYELLRHVDIFNAVLPLSMQSVSSC